jgi:hypothetical protein
MGFATAAAHPVSRPAHRDRGALGLDDEGLAADRGLIGEPRFGDFAHDSSNVAGSARMQVSAQAYDCIRPLRDDPHRERVTFKGQVDGIQDAVNAASTAPKTLSSAALVRDQHPCPSADRQRIGLFAGPSSGRTAGRPPAGPSAACR